MGSHNLANCLTNELTRNDFLKLIAHIYSTLKWSVSSYKGDSILYFGNLSFHGATFRVPHPALFTASNEKLERGL